MQGPSSLAIALSLSALTILGLVSPAFGEGKSGNIGNVGSVDGDFFSTPDSSQQPGFTKAKEGGDGLRNKLLGNKKDGIPDWQQVKMIPSLSREQRKELQEIYQSAKGQIKPMLDEMKAMRTQFGENKQAALKDPATRQKLRQMREHLLAKRQAVWETAKAKLSPQQIEELELMRKGQLMPASLNQSGSDQSAGMPRPETRDEMQAP
jgi:hypothetical protein